MFMRKKRKKGMGREERERGRERRKRDRERRKEIDRGEKRRK